MARTDTAKDVPLAAAQPAKKREYVKQAEIPSKSLDAAIRIPLALAEQYGKRPATPIEVAAALGVQPKTGNFRRLTGAAVAYGMIDGGAYAEMIGLTDLGRRIVAPTVEGDDDAAKREALMKPRVIREFLERYDGSPLPARQIGCNVLETMGVPAARTQQTLDLITEGAEALGLITTINGKKHVSIRATHLRAVPTLVEEPEDDAYEDPPLEAAPDGGGLDNRPPDALSDDADVPDVPQPPERNRRVFVSHGSNRQIVQHLKELLEYGEYEPVVAVEREATSKPVPDKVLDDMRSCAAGIIHIGVEQVITDAGGNEHPQLNSNVLIEIGAAMALYGRNFILLVEDGTKLPSNLQGLYEVRYEGKSMDAGATMKLLKAFKEFKS